MRTRILTRRITKDIRYHYVARAHHPIYACARAPCDTCSFPNFLVWKPTSTMGYKIATARGVRTLCVPLIASLWWYFQGFPQILLRTSTLEPLLRKCTTSFWIRLPTIKFICDISGVQVWVSARDEVSGWKRCLLSHFHFINVVAYLIFDETTKFRRVLYWSVLCRPPPRLHAYA